VPQRLPLILPADEAFDEARFAFNGMIDRRPAAIARPRSEEEVLAALAYAVDADLGIAVRGGGHSVAGHSCCDGGLLVDLRAMRRVEVDSQARRARAAGGTTWREFDPACLEHGLAMPGGTFDTTGIAGLTLGGGIGYLIGAYGLTLDNLVSARMATLDGEIVTASAEDEEELFWALRGGGGNFGVVTSFEYRLHPLSTVYGGVLLLPLDRAHDGLRAFRELMEEAPDELTAMALLSQQNPVDAQTLVIYVCFIGTDGEGERQIEALRRLKPLHDDVRRRPYLELQRITGELPFGLRHYWKSYFLRELPDEAIDPQHRAFRIARPAGARIDLDRTVSRGGPPGSARRHRVERALGPVQRELPRDLGRRGGRRPRDRLVARLCRLDRALVHGGWRGLPQLRQPRRTGRADQSRLRRLQIHAATGGEAAMGPGQSFPFQQQRPARRDAEVSDLIQPTLADVAKTHSVAPAGNTGARIRVAEEPKGDTGPLALCAGLRCSNR